MYILVWLVIITDYSKRSIKFNVVHIGWPGRPMSNAIVEACESCAKYHRGNPPKRGYLQPFSCRKFNGIGIHRHMWAISTKPEMRIDSSSPWWITSRNMQPLTVYRTIRLRQSHVKLCMDGFPSLVHQFSCWVIKEQSLKANCSRNFVEHR